MSRPEDYVLDFFSSSNTNKLDTAVRCAFLAKEEYWDNDDEYDVNEDEFLDRVKATIISLLTETQKVEFNL